MAKHAKIATSKNGKAPVVANKGQIAVIVFGAGLNEEKAMQDYIDQGFDVRNKGDHAEVWVKEKTKEQPQQ